MTTIDAKTEVVRRLCDDLTKDIKNISDKGWLIPALTSHVAHLLEIDYDGTDKYVRSWWTRQTKNRQS